MARNARAVSLAQEAIAADSRGMAGVAERLGISRTTLSLYMADKYPAEPAKIEEKIMGLVDEVECPALGGELVNRSWLCANYAGFGEPPTHNPMRHQHWQTCQTCPHKPD
jgi:hypothetical protein